jgi:hypothetical protein
MKTGTGGSFSKEPLNTGLGTASDIRPTPVLGPGDRKSLTKE